MSGVVVYQRLADESVVRAAGRMTRPHFLRRNKDACRVSIQMAFMPAGVNLCLDPAKVKGASTFLVLTLSRK